MKKTALIILLLAAANVFALPQELQQAITEIKNDLHEIRSVRYTVNQSILPVSGSIVDFQLNNTDSKGRVSSTTYRVDLADIDPLLLTSGVERDMMKVEVHAKGKQRFITELKGGEVTRYTDRFKLDVRDMDNARQLMDAFKKGIAVAESMDTYKGQFGSLREVLLELSSLVKPLGNTVSVQKILVSEDRAEKLQHVIRRGDGVVLKHEFNLKDMNATTVDYVASGRNLSIKLNTYGGSKAVKRYQNDLAKDFVPNFTVAAETVEQAKKIKALFELAINAANGNALKKTHSAPSRSSAPPSGSSASRKTSSAQTPSQDNGGFPKVELTKDPESGKYAWAGVYHFPGQSLEELYRAAEASIPTNMVISKTDNQIVFQRMGGNRTALRLGGDAYISFTIKVSFKEGKIRMEETDFFYDNRAWGFSAPQTLETMNAKKLNKIVGDINERLTKGNNTMMDGLKTKLRLTSQEEDW